MKPAQQMKNTYQTEHAAQLSKILGMLPSNADSTLKRFVSQFYAKIPVADLKHYEPAQAIAIATSAYKFFGDREPGKPKIRIFSPNKKTHGYDSKHTVVELINDDMPFLVDSFSAELSRHGFTIRETIHPIFKVQRDKKGNLDTLLDADKKTDALIESLIHFEISALPEGLSTQQLTSDLEWVLQHICATVSGWSALVDKAQDTIKNLDALNKSAFDKATVAESQDFLRWLMDRNFIFMGYAEYNFYDSKGKEKLAVIPSSRLGILKIAEESGLQGLEMLPPELQHFLLGPNLIDIAKSTRRSPVHRAVLMDTISIKRFDNAGKVIGESRFIGLFTSNVYYQNADAIPIVRTKIASTLTRSDFAPDSHDGKALKTIFEMLPRDELFQISDDELFETSMGILALEARPGVRVFFRKDLLERFVSLMVFIPRERFSTELRQQIQGLFEQSFNGTTSSFSTQITEAPLARLHLIVKTAAGDIPAVNITKLESDIARRAYLWGDLLLEALQEKYDEQKAEKLQRIYASAFPQGYINRHDSNSAVFDIGKIEEALERQSMALELFRNKRENEDFLHLKIYNPNDEIALSDILPMLENAGFRVIDEHPFLVAPQGAMPVWVRDFKLQVTDGAALPLQEIKPLLEETLLKVWRLEVENDRFNTLVLKSQLHWRQVVVLRTYARYLKQIGFSYTQATIEQAMNLQPQIAKSIVALFEARFSPDVKNRDEKQQALQTTIEEQLGQVTNATFDRILRRYVELLMATLRTNYYHTQEDGSTKPVLSLKFDSGKVPELPKPAPFAEIFVYGIRVEGIHLRGGRVARGGLRWSDRPEDFRTEVLGLMKAQMVKNSVIVPVGSKGGFFVRRPPFHREAVLAEGIECYKMYLRGLLDITDNIVNNKIIAPKQTVRHDGDDPYLVVAADKGTATFSDIANGVSAEYNFWLGDAFASGGSAGYDHKKMAITARGAWISVVRHFHEMGVDIDTQEFTCVGIGDMAGDVFGNGMLLSERVQLVAAFNHMHIFIDPSPDAKASFAERKRLFNLPRSTWKDYEAKLISKGGGIFERSAKTITLSKEAQNAIGAEKAKLTPDEVIRAILLSPVDLLWNGGIGTYVKAEEESHEQVGDRTNNALRVNGRELRCKVVGEGGNLGFTQKGRIEYAKNGGRINTDAIDNSAGVDCSDHEVNIKITFSREVAKGTLTIEKRDKQLAAMTEEVAQLVLKDNTLQTQAITNAQIQGPRLLEAHSRLMHRLESHGLLNRGIEFLPNDKQMADLKAAKKGLTRPELAVLLAYSKMALYNELLQSNLPDEDYFIADLKRYFPKTMQNNAAFADAISEHRLRREIIATVATNSLVNRAGITFVFDIAEDLGVGARDVAAAYTLVRDAFNLRGMWNAIEKSQGISVAGQAEIQKSLSDFLERVTGWLLRNSKLPIDINQLSKTLLPAVADMEKYADTLYSDATRQAADERRKQLEAHGVPADLAEKLVGLEMMSSAFNIISAAQKTGLKVQTAGQVYFELGARIQFGWLRRSAYTIAPGSYWDRLAIQSIIGDLYDEQRRLTVTVIEKLCKDGKCNGSVEAWAEAIKDDLQRFDRFIDGLKSGESLDVPKLMVALRHIRGLH
jgi:glutamate dehydrogenase